MIIFQEEKLRGELLDRLRKTKPETRRVGLRVPPGRWPWMNLDFWEEGLVALEE